MQRNECKPGTEVIIRGTIIKDDGTDFSPIKITIRRDDGKTEDGFFEPSALEPAQPKYDPARKYRKGDLVRITGYHGRLFGCGGERKLSEGNEIGIQVTLYEDELIGGEISLPDGVLSNKYSYLSVACIELVKPIEEIEAEQPYLVKETPCYFDVYKKEDKSRWYASFCYYGGLLNKEQAKACAEACCDELNRKHRESLDA